MRNGMMVALVACALAACSPTRDDRPVVGSQSYGEPAADLHSARIAGYSWERPEPGGTGAVEPPPAKPDQPIDPGPEGAD